MNDDLTPPSQNTPVQPPAVPGLNAEPAAPSQEPISSYVDAYQPVNSSVTPPTPAAPVSPSVSDNDDALATPAPVMPPAASSPTSSSAPTSAEGGQSLEEQNIFVLLGVADATDEEKEAFLDELQQVIWEDFLENDVELLLTSEEHTGLKQLMGDKPTNDLEQQEAIITYLEKYIPDLEEVMLEKALELKEDMVRERAAGLREFFASQTDKLAQLDKADQLMTQGQWRSVAETLNSLQ